MHEIADDERIYERHVTSHDKDMFGRCLLQSCIETTQASTVGNEVTDHRVRRALERRAVLGDDDHHLFKNCVEDLKTPLEQRLFSDQQVTLILSHSSTFSSRKEDA